MGESRWGKTQWARSLEESHIYIAGLFAADALAGRAGYIVLDDIDFKYFPHWKSFVGCQRNFYVTDKYRHKIRVDGGWPCIICSNDDNDPRGAISRTELDWFDMNCVTMRLTGPLY